MITSIFPQIEFVNRPSAVQRIMNVATLRLVSMKEITVVPSPIVTFVLVLMVSIIGGLRMSVALSDIADSHDGFQRSDKGPFFFSRMMVVAAMATRKTYLFSTGYSVTRRGFSLVASLAFLWLSAGYALELARFCWFAVGP